MGKFIIAQKILNQHFINIALRHAEILLNEKNIEPNTFQNDLNTAKTPEDFKGVFKKYFGDEIKLIDIL